jgi:hypothetical protein
MKKYILFFLSVTIAFGINLYIKKNKYSIGKQNSPEWKTYEKIDNKIIATHKTTDEELIEANKTAKSNKMRSPSSINSDQYKGFKTRNNRVLMGQIVNSHEDLDLEMTNDINPDWKEMMGNNLLKFQPEGTKILVKEEKPVIQIDEGKGKYLEQVLITYLKKDGSQSSFKALIDSETGAIVQTWDRTINERLTNKKSASITIPNDNESGIIAR